METKLDFKPFDLLSKAPDKLTVNRTFQESFRCRFDGLSEMRKERWAEWYHCDADAADTLFDACLSLIQHVIYENLSEATECNALFPAGFHAKLKKLIIKILIANFDSWRSVSVTSGVSAVSKLIDFEWRCDVKKSSSTLRHMSVPAVVVSFKVQEPQQRLGILAPTRNVQFEMSKESLGAMVDGLNRIKAQLKKL